MHFHYPTIDSTNTQASRLLAAGIAPPFIVTAGTQTQGRGQRGNQWESPSGNFYGSVVFPYPITAMQAAVAVAETIGDQAQIKWPNDILINNHKVAGILIEQLVNGPSIIGVGINVCTAPLTTSYPATSLAAVSITPPSNLGGNVQAALQNASNQSTPVIHQHYQQRLAWYEERVSLTSPEKNIQGQLTGVQPDGAICIDAMPYYNGQLRKAYHA